MKTKLHFALHSAFIALCLVNATPDYAQGFPSTATNWPLPVGGETYNGTNFSFRELSYRTGGADDNGSQSWTVMDINGDRKPDMVILSQNQNDDTLVFSQGNSKYWKVYLGTGTGFSQSATNWALPVGGETYNGVNLSFRELSYRTGAADDNGSQSWSIMDMNGDSKPDIVILAENQNDDTLVFGQGNSKYWKVYLNTGSGFSQSATNWALPVGGETYNGVNLSFRELSYNTGAADDNGSQSWSIMDMNGDSKPDILIRAQNQNDDTLVFGQGNSKYWKVYLNTGSGFSQSATNWSLPVGGETYAGANLSFRELSYNTGAADDNGSQSWSIMDMNGDNKPDVLIRAENQNDDTLVFGQGNSKYWKVYLNTGSGFSQSATNWSLPVGGETYAGANLSFRELSYNTGAADDNGSQSWSIMDMNGDSKPDVLIRAQNQNDDTLVFGQGNSKYWKVYLNTGSGFSQSATNCSLPVGGETYAGANLSFRELSYNTGAADDNGSQSWSIMDMNGDSKPDILIRAENQNDDTLVFGQGNSKYWKVYLNNGTLSLPSQIAQQPIMAYPNPVTDAFFIAANAELIGQEFTIFDINGRVIKSGTLSADVNRIDLSQAASGVYFIKVNGSQNATVKVVKR